MKKYSSNMIKEIMEQKITLELSKEEYDILLSIIEYVKKRLENRSIVTSSTTEDFINEFK